MQDIPSRTFSETIYFRKGGFHVSTRVLNHASESLIKYAIFMFILVRTQYYALRRQPVYALPLRHSAQLI